MHASFEISSASGTYTVEIGNGLLSKTLSRADDSIILCDQRFAPSLTNHGLAMIAVAATEDTKSLRATESIVTQMRHLGTHRGSRLLAIGGGVIQDIATFCASIYMRGIPWSYAPTTLLGMADSCIGGKSSINVGPYKNLIGNIYPPDRILVDIDQITTLTTEQRVAGMCEAVKICFARSQDDFQRYLETAPRPDAAAERFAPILVTSLAAKKWFIEVDEFDQNERLLLNFGHTFGHAIESASNFAITHGIAVGLGILAAIELGRKLGYYDSLPEPVFQLRKYIVSLLSEIPEKVTLNVTTVNGASLMPPFLADKKHSRTHMAVIIPQANGELKRIMLEKTAHNISLVTSAFSAAFLT